ncbi:hypothetical protein FSU_0963 [Fibrobacter succinogenes subsp. succinogenes S85]|uniref:Uncharacterized protein n=1 Tax=Fibrobacter succinogenes (strain ATCC 19169 / S85) TaxID=59374 RepID=C9RLY8_FIBSS|nr:hypothetical protein [Fibrobacter succinogenes]ACX74150.1 hypothetical protein Fisuc_0538 [Fibrobacter succinogenes subsp. succinogenes S85]ADL26588.1 hypothetical protein FSU_0963 [Fibrobacter succinogenes subsp. succinogenes S85]
MFFWNKRIAPVAARMMTWEVTTAFDGMPTETELRKRFDEDFRDVFNAGFADGECAVFFWQLVSFNASDGRKHRYLVAVADEPLENYRKTFDRCLPKQIALYAIADKILRGERDGENCLKCDEACAECGGECAEVAENGNLLFVAFWGHCLYILVFMEGRLCHWSEEYGYGEVFDDACRERVARFKEFLKADELFAKMNDVGEFGEGSPKVDELFQVAVRDPFWRGKDLDECDSMKPCERRRWIMSVVALFVFCACVFAMSGGSLNLLCAKFYDDEFHNSFVNVAPVELSQPAARDLEMLAWAEGHRDLLPAKWTLGRAGFVDGVASRSWRTSRGTCDSSEFSLLGIVGGRVALVKTSAGETKTLSVGDSLSRYRVKRIGMNDVVMRCGRKEVRYALKMR